MLGNDDGIAGIAAKDASDANWGAKNRVVFETTNPSNYVKGWGIADAAMTAPRPKANPLIPGTFYSMDTDPTWAPMT